MSADSSSGTGFFDSLDTLIGTVGNVVSSKNAAQIAAQTQNNATAANAVAVAQQAAAKNNTWMYVAVAVVLIGTVYFIARR